MVPSFVQNIAREYRSSGTEKSTFSGRDCPAMLQTKLQQKAKAR
jgi:hypothetical protein